MVNKDFCQRNLWSLLKMKLKVAGLDMVVKSEDWKQFNWASRVCFYIAGFFLELALELSGKERKPNGR